MWPFRKKTKLPGFNKDHYGNWIFELTDEERREVQSIFDMLKDPEGTWCVKKEAADDIQQGMAALGLSFYAIGQILQSKLDIYKEREEEFVNKAIASTMKAYSFCPLPIYMYDIACFMEMNGRISEARSVFGSFLELQSKFKPSQIQEIISNVQRRDIDEAIKYAKEKVV
jgi:hypothetical protein